MNILSPVNIYVSINSSLLVLVDEIKDCLKMYILIQSNQQDSIKNAIIFLTITISDSKNNLVKTRF